MASVTGSLGAGMDIYVVNRILGGLAEKCYHCSEISGSPSNHPSFPDKLPVPKFSHEAPSMTISDQGTSEETHTLLL